MKIIMLVGMMGSGKSMMAEGYVKYVRLNRDREGGRVRDLIPKMEKELDGGRDVILDNTFGSRESRRGFLEVGKRRGIGVECIWLDVGLMEAQFNCAGRMLERYGKLLGPEEIKSSGDPNMFSPVVLENYSKGFEEPTLEEGFSSVERVKFVRRGNPLYVERGLMLDFDGTLRKTRSGELYPRVESDVEVLLGRREKILEYEGKGWKICGVSNQSGVAKGEVSKEVVEGCFRKTVEMLGVGIDWVYCPHINKPIGCYCRKPMSGWAVYFQRKYNLDLGKSLFVGDMGSDREFAKNAGMEYVEAKEFFGC